MEKEMMDPLGDDTPLYRILLTGETSVGKTKMIKSYCGDFDDEFVKLVGVDYKLRQIQFDVHGNQTKKHAKIQLWDSVKNIYFS